MDRIPLEYLRITHNVPAGANPLVLMSLAYLMRGTNEDPEPVSVQKISDTDYVILDGRHRYIAAIIAGRPDLLCEIKPG